MNLILTCAVCLLCATNTTSNNTTPHVKPTKTNKYRIIAGLVIVSSIAIAAYCLYPTKESEDTKKNNTYLQALRRNELVDVYISEYAMTRYTDVQAKYRIIGQKQVYEIHFISGLFSFKTTATDKQKQQLIDIYRHFINYVLGKDSKPDWFTNQKYHWDMSHKLLSLTIPESEAFDDKNNAKIVEEYLKMSISYLIQYIPSIADYVEP